MADFKKSHIFSNIRGHLAVHKNDRPHKFCFDCCIILEGANSKLNRHYKSRHKGETAKFLGYYQIPKRCVYDDFDKFLQRTDSPDNWEDDH